LSNLQLIRSFFQQLLAEEAKKQMTPKERQEERTRQQKQVEEADLALAIDMMGMCSKGLLHCNSIHTDL